MAESTAADMALTCLKSMSSLENENVDTTASDIIDVASSDPTTSSSDTIDNIGRTDESDEITEAALPVQQQHPTTGLTCRRCRYRLGLETVEDEPVETTTTTRHSTRGTNVSVASARKNITIATKSTIRDQNLEKAYKAASIQQHIDDELFLDIPQPSIRAMRLTTGFSSGRASKARRPANPPKSLTVVPLPYKQDDTFPHAAQKAQTYNTTARTTGPGSGKQWSAAQTTLLEKDHELSQRRNAESTGDRNVMSRPYGYVGMKREGALWLGEDDRESEEECSSSTAKAFAEGHWSDGSVPDLVADDGSSPPSSPTECGELDGAEKQGWREVGQRIKEAYEHNKEQPTMPEPTEPHWTDGSAQEPPHWADGSYPSPNARQPRPTYHLPTGFDAYLDLEEGDHWVSAEASGPPHSLLYIKFRGLAMAEDAARASSGAWAEADAWELDRRLAEAHRLRRGRACDEATGAY
ncbi:hypothetical protein LTR56_013134 [Elasticomyces elasticus]|nr:hypothetical protein LTR56_013134 [Elasticomyces elasticus]KAK3656690.1 hypothetical protein LTR22_009669 [Elasticomyces elasticus]KAK4921562.1 hypothetical protein LTR49_011032 [Elasticomyces elasticus]KAK5760250.1 hypothetical protein LTS12_009634 [Elasticomyces elasticus]